MIALSTAKISQASLSSLDSSKISLQAQQYAAAEATLLEAAAYDSLTGHNREEIDNSGYESEIELSEESNYEDDIMQRTATINIYFGNDVLPRYTLKKLLLRILLLNVGIRIIKVVDIKNGMVLMNTL